MLTSRVFWVATEGPIESHMDEDEIIHTELELLKYVEEKFGEEYIANGVSFNRSNGLHVEFYVYGPTHIAICIYKCKSLPFIVLEERVDLLVLRKHSKMSMIDFAAREKLKYIKRLGIGPVERRIKD